MCAGWRTCLFSKASLGTCILNEHGWHLTPWSRLAALLLVVPLALDLFWSTSHCNISLLVRGLLYSN